MSRRGTSEVRGDVHPLGKRGHNIPEPDIRHRFDRGIANFKQHYRAAVDVWQIFDASQWPPVLVDEGVNS